MSVRRGIFPPCRASSLSFSKSRGSKAILLPPSKAEPACATSPPPLFGGVPLGIGCVVTSFEGEELPATLRLERPVELIALPVQDYWRALMAVPGCGAMCTATFSRYRVSVHFTKTFVERSEIGKGTSQSLRTIVWSLFTDISTRSESLFMDQQFIGVIFQFKTTAHDAPFRHF
jgi:hypothetical protein